MIEPKKSVGDLAAVIEAVDKQLAEDIPAITRVTFERLKSEGVSEYDAKVMIGSVFAREIRRIVLGAKRLNLKRYAENLKRLSADSWNNNGW